MHRLSILLRTAGYAIYIATATFFVSSLIGLVSANSTLSKDATASADVRPPGDAFGFFYLQVLFRSFLDGPGLIGIALLLPVTVALIYFGYVCTSTAKRIDRSKFAEQRAADELAAAIAARKAGVGSENEQ